jgi:uncharacterized protein YwqG
MCLPVMHIYHKVILPLIACHKIKRIKVKKLNVEDKKNNNSHLNEARDYVRSQRLTDDLMNFGINEVGNYADQQARGLYFNGSKTLPFYQLSPEILSKSLNYLINTNENQILDETEIPLGSSKVKGLPHLPDEFIWPDGAYFFAQINLEELDKVDICKLLPKQGMLYIFLNPEEYKCFIFNYKGPLNTLKLRNYPDLTNSSLNYDKRLEDKFKREAVTIKFKPEFIFYINEIDELIPSLLTLKIAEIMGCGMAHRKSYINLLSQPFYYQGEDEGYIDTEDIDRTDDEDSDILLFQGEFGEGHVHFWLKLKDLKNEDFSSCYITYSGT